MTAYEICQLRVDLESVMRRMQTLAEGESIPFSPVIQRWQSLSYTIASDLENLRVHELQKAVAEFEHIFAAHPRENPRNG